ncbi:hypothetical protein GJ496_007665 [Pomphorhynchus laevis]|nr:hypothetical protein GJ496_007665 [Pomphorhynchus laevis]
MITFLEQLWIYMDSFIWKLMSAGDDGKVVYNDFKSALEELHINSKPYINMLTMLAEECQHQANYVVQAIEERLVQASPDTKMPILYVLDSIIKNLKETDYLSLFDVNIVKLFVQTFEQLDDRNRQALHKLRMTWIDVFSNRKLYAIDVAINKLDSGWPIVASPEMSIHVNPNFMELASKHSGPISTLSTNTSTVQPSVKVLANISDRDPRLAKMKDTNTIISLKNKAISLLSNDAVVTDLKKRRKRSEHAVSTFKPENSEMSDTPISIQRVESPIFGACGDKDYRSDLMPRPWNDSSCYSFQQSVPPLPINTTLGNKNYVASNTSGHLLINSQLKPQTNFVQTVNPHNFDHLYKSQSQIPNNVNNPDFFSNIGKSLAHQSSVPPNFTHNNQKHSLLQVPSPHHEYSPFYSSEFITSCQSNPQRMPWMINQSNVHKQPDCFPISTCVSSVPTLEHKLSLSNVRKVNHRENPQFNERSICSVEVDGRTLDMKPNTRQIFQIYGIRYEFLCDLTAKTVFLNSKPLIKFRDPRKYIDLPGPRSRRVGIQYMGQLIDLWIDGHHFKVRIDAMATRITLHNENHTIALNSSNKEFIVDNVVRAIYNEYEPFHIHLNERDRQQYNRLHEVCFSPPPMVVHVDGVQYRMRFAFDYKLYPEEI